MRLHGVQLRNPIVAAAGPATETADRVAQCIEQGVGAVILKSAAPAGLLGHGPGAPRRMFYRDGTLFMLSSTRREFLSVEEASELVAVSKRLDEVPIIGSSAGTLEGASDWSKTLAALAHAGADMLQVDSFYALATRLEAGWAAVTELVAFAEDVQRSADRPVLLKFGPEVPVGIAAGALRGRGIGLSILDSMEVGVPVDVRTGGSAFRGVSVHGRCRAAGRILYPLALLYTQRLAPLLPERICAGGGIMNAADAQALLLSGAACVQVATALCVGGIRVLGDLLRELRALPTDQEEGLTYGDVTTIIQGQVQRCPPTQPLCASRPCSDPIMCLHGSCEGCGLCIDLCPVGYAQFMRDHNGD